MRANGILIVGGGLASARAIEAYRESGGEEPVALTSADTFLPYHRPPLSKKFIRGEAEAEDAIVENEAFYRDHAVDVQLETRARGLRLDTRTVDFEDGATRSFRKLLIATGASPRRLDVAGADGDNVFMLRTIDDARRIREAARAADRAVVIGAGFIGMEVAASLTQLGVAVTLVHRGRGLFEALHSPQLSEFLGELYRSKGVEVVIGDEAAAFTRDGVTTKGGRMLGADMVVVGVGVRPNTEWLDGSGLDLDDGVVVSERFEAGVDGVYAAGDVARFYDPLFEKHRRIEHWSNANYQGTQVGHALAGGDVRYDTVSTFFSEVFGVTFKVFGEGHAADFDEMLVRGGFDAGDAIVFYLRNGRLVTCLLVGQDEDTENRLKAWLRDRATAPEAARLADAGTDLDDCFEPARSR